MNPKLGWALAAIALAVGYAIAGWQGVVLAVTIIAFWLLLQFSQVMRVMRGAARSPVGHVPNAVMLNAKLHAGMRMLDVVALTRSLGQRVREVPEQYAWRDDEGNRVDATFDNGRLLRWELVRAAAT